MSSPTAAEKTDDVRRPRPWRPALVLLLLAAIAVGWGGMHWRVFRPPYHGISRQLAWLLGEPEAAYNFGTLVPERVFRGSLPDQRFVEYLRDEYGVRRIVSLMGRHEVHRQAESLGMTVATFEWSSEHLPPQAELDEVLALLESTDEPVLLHCRGGLDRTGYAAAFYRVSRDGWAVEDALEEMTRYWHRPERHGPLERDIRARLSGPSD